MKDAHQINNCTLIHRLHILSTADNRARLFSELSRSIQANVKYTAADLGFKYQGWQYSEGNSHYLPQFLQSTPTNKSIVGMVV